ncbi:MAG: hypothetical protein EXS25_05385 [Pedosphaera sp.]|nr:hypothetical protein [Pedosphaera sp.]
MTVSAYYVDEAMSEVYRGGEKVPAGMKWEAGYRLPTESADSTHSMIKAWFGADSHGRGRCHVSAVRRASE